jgi:putative transposase
VTSSERQELATLRRENRRLREDVDALKRATVHSTRLSSRRRPGDGAPVHRGGEAGSHNVQRACELLKVSRTAFCARRARTPGPRAVRDAELTGQITEVYTRSRGTYGAPRVHAVLKREGAGCGRRRVARLMRAAGLQGRHRRRRHLTTIPDPRAAIRPDLVVRDFPPDATALDARLCGDITYIPTEEGWLHLATVIDIAWRRVVGWATAEHLRTELVADAVMAACRQRRPTRTVIFHSDRGCRAIHQSAIRRPGGPVRHSAVRRPHWTVLGRVKCGRGSRNPRRMRAGDRRPGSAGRSQRRRRSSSVRGIRFRGARYAARGWRGSRWRPPPRTISRSGAWSTSRGRRVRPRSAHGPPGTRGPPRP